MSESWLSLLIPLVGLGGLILLLRPAHRIAVELHPIEPAIMPCSALELPPTSDTDIPAAPPAR